MATTGELSVHFFSMEVMVWWGYHQWMPCALLWSEAILAINAWGQQTPAEHIVAYTVGRSKTLREQHSLNGFGTDGSRWRSIGGWQYFYRLEV